ncbi:MAG: polysaccharide deacetylase family protein [Acidimicrobiales bacterium]
MSRVRRNLLLFTVVVAIGLVIVARTDHDSNLSASGTSRPTSTSMRAPTSTHPTSTESTTTAPTTTVPPTTAAPATTAVPVAPGAPNTPGGITVGALPRDKGAVPLVGRVPTFDPVVFITMDDGMKQDPAILQYIRDNHIPVTLFLNGNFVRSNPDYFREFQALGASIEAHTNVHADLRKLPPDGQAAATCELQKSFTDTFGAAPAYFRPPYGNWTAASLDASPGCGIKAQVLWKATMNNGQIQMQTPPLRAGDIILMHFRDDTVANLTALMQMLPIVGLHPANLVEYLDAAPVA